jgi:hypothetical protein
LALRPHPQLEALDVQHQHFGEAVHAQVLGGGRLLAAPLAMEGLNALQGVSVCVCVC